MNAAAAQTTLLDAALLRRQRIALGLSERDLAKRLGVSGQVVASLERGLNHDDLPLSLLRSLAGVLAMPVKALLSSPVTATDPPTDAATSEPAQAELAADARTVGGLLAAEPTLMPVLTLAQVLGWEPNRVLAALAALEPLLAAVGWRLHRLGGDVKVVGDATVVPPETLSSLGRRSFARRGMSLSQARLLRRAWLGELTGAEHGNADRVAIGDLMNAGLLEVPAGAARGTQPTLSVDAAFGLGAVEVPSA